MSAVRKAHNCLQASVEALHREAWGMNVEAKVEAAWLHLDALSLANERELAPHTKGLIELRDKLDIALGKALAREVVS